MTKSETPSPNRNSSFPTTNWSQIGKLKDDGFSAALDELCQRYWYPIYAFIRRRYADSHQAEDLTQGFFQKVLGNQGFRAADPGKGRFRSYLLVSVRNYLASQYAAGNSARRGGRHQVMTIDPVLAEETFTRNRVSDLSPDEEFDRAWALTLLDRAIGRLKAEYASRQQELRFELLAPMLRSSGLEYDAIAAELGIDVVATRKAASRFRQRYGELLREEIAATLSDNDSVEQEISWMKTQFSR